MNRNVQWEINSQLTVSVDWVLSHLHISRWPTKRPSKRASTIWQFPAQLSEDPINQIPRDGSMSIEIAAFVVPTNSIRGRQSRGSKMHYSKLLMRPGIMISHHLPSFRSVSVILICVHVLPCEYLLVTAGITHILVHIKQYNFQCDGTEDNGVNLT